MNQQASFEMSQGYEVIPPKPGKAYPIPCDEWDFLKRKIRVLSDSVNIYHTGGSVLLGASLTTFITILTGSIGTTRASSSVTMLVIAWAVVAVTLILGCACLYFGWQQRKLKQVQASDILTQMEIIERRYLPNGDE